MRRGRSTPGVTNLVSINGDEVPIPGTVSFSAYDVNGNLIDSGSANDTAGGLYRLSDSGIHEFRISSSSGTVAFDNLTFNAPIAARSSDAPEPATGFLLMIAAAGGVALRIFQSRQLRSK